MEDGERRRLCRQFLQKGLEKRKPQRDEFTAYGHACWEMAVGTFQTLQQMDAVIFACMIPRGCRKPANFSYEEYLRKDHVFLLERFYYFLQEREEYGLLVMDEVEDKEDRKSGSPCPRCRDTLQRHRRVG